MSVTPGFTVDPEHDWHDAAYVDKWIARDVTREERPAVLGGMIELAPFPHDAAIAVLDVGGGNGLVTAAVLAVFPNAKVTVQDYSAPMLERAKERFASYGDQLSYALSDLFDPAWPSTTFGPYDMVVSSIAIHNLGTIEAMVATYKSIYDLLKPGGVFLDCDHFGNVGGVGMHVEAMTKLGFSKAVCVNEAKPAIVTATK
jgi:ubiquinone/menaquinone biosynthesis C-methylase UbiE